MRCHSRSEIIRLYMRGALLIPVSETGLQSGFRGGRQERLSKANAFLTRAAFHVRQHKGLSAPSSITVSNRGFEPPASRQWRYGRKAVIRSSDSTQKTRLPLNNPPLNRRHDARSDLSS